MRNAVARAAPPLTAAAQECSVKDDLIRDLEAERVVHCSALADLRSSTASLASTIEAVTRTLAPLASGKHPLYVALLHYVVTPPSDVDQVDASLWRTLSSDSSLCCAMTATACTLTHSGLRQFSCCTSHFVGRV